MTSWQRREGPLFGAYPADVSLRASGAGQSGCEDCEEQSASPGQAGCWALGLGPCRTSDRPLQQFGRIPPARVRQGPASDEQTNEASLETHARHLSIANGWVRMESRTSVPRREPSKSATCDRTRKLGMETLVNCLISISHGSRVRMPPVVSDIMCLKSGCVSRPACLLTGRCLSTGAHAYLCIRKEFAPSRWVDVAPTSLQPPPPPLPPSPLPAACSPARPLLRPVCPYVRIVVRGLVSSFVRGRHVGNCVLT